MLKTWKYPWIYSMTISDLFSNQSTHIRGGTVQQSWYAQKSNSIFLINLLTFNVNLKQTFFFNRKMLLQNFFYERYLLPWDKYLRRTFRKLVICLEFPNHQLVEFLILITFVLIIQFLYTVLMLHHTLVLYVKWNR